MSNDPTTSDGVKSVHQQCIETAKVDAALARAESPSGAINEGDAGLLAAEVRRLLEELRCVQVEAAAWRENADAHRKHGDHVCEQRAQLLAENERLSAQYQHVDAELGVFKTTAQALNGRINELEAQAVRLRGSRAKLARVEALPAKLRLAAGNARRHDPEERAESAGLRWAALKLDEALRDQQPSAAPTPTKKGEPYNGY